MIFTIHNGKDEYEMWGGYYRMRLIPAQDKMVKIYCDEMVIPLSEPQMHNLMVLPSYK